MATDDDIRNLADYIIRTEELSEDDRRRLAAALTGEGQVSAGAVQPGNGVRWKVVRLAGDERAGLKVGDEVVVAQSVDYNNVLIRVSDLTIHPMVYMDEYVTLVNVR